MSAVDSKSAPDHTDTKAENALATKILLFVLVAVVLWGGAIFMWGVPGLYLPAVALVPVIYLLMILGSRG